MELEIVDDAVDRKPFDKYIVEVVAEIPAAGWLHASYEVNPVAEVKNPASLLNHESLIDDDAIVLTCPLEPVYANPCERDGK